MGVFIGLPFSLGQAHHESAALLVPGLLMARSPPLGRAKAQIARVIMVQSAQSGSNAREAVVRSRVVKGPELAEVSVDSSKSSVRLRCRATVRGCPHQTVMGQLRFSDRNGWELIVLVTGMDLCSAHIRDQVGSDRRILRVCENTTAQRDRKLT